MALLAPGVRWRKTGCRGGGWRCSVRGVMDSARLLAAYDRQLRTDAETPGAASVTRLGPLRLVTFAGGRGFITYRDLDGAGLDAIGRLSLIHISEPTRLGMIS